jgi:hypothetical protein
MRSQPAWPGGQATNAAAHAPRWAATDGAGTPEHAPRSCTDARTLAPLHHGGLAPATIRKRTVRGVRLHAGTPPRAARAIGCRRRLLPAARMTAAERRPKACATGRGSQPPQCGARGRRGHACGTAVPPAPAASRRARTPVPEGQMRTSLPGAAASAASVPSMRHSGDSATAASSWGCRAGRPRQRRLAALSVHEDACPSVLADALGDTQGRKWGQPDWCGFARPVLAVPSGGLTTTGACNRAACSVCHAQLREARAACDWRRPEQGRRHGDPNGRLCVETATGRARCASDCGASSMQAAARASAAQGGRGGAPCAGLTRPRPGVGRGAAHPQQRGQLVVQRQPQVVRAAQRGAQRQHARAAAVAAPVRLPRARPPGSPACAARPRARPANSRGPPLPPRTPCYGCAIRAGRARRAEQAPAPGPGRGGCIDARARLGARRGGWAHQGGHLQERVVQRGLQGVLLGAAARRKRRQAAGALVLRPRAALRGAAAVSRAPPTRAARAPAPRMTRGCSRGAAGARPHPPCGGAAAGQAPRITPPQLPQLERARDLGTWSLGRAPARKRRPGRRTAAGRP